MYLNLKIVKIDSKYCDYLRNFDSRVPYNAGVKELRPFIGVLFRIDSCEYFAPLSSPKPKHKLLKNTSDLLKIEDGKYEVVNFNNMIPVTKNNCIVFDLNKKYSDKEKQFRMELLNNQLRWLTSNKKQVFAKSRLLYDLYRKNKLPKNVSDRCCNFLLLEHKSLDYNNI